MQSTVLEKLCINERVLLFPPRRATACAENELLMLMTFGKTELFSLLLILYSFINASDLLFKTTPRFSNFFFCHQNGSKCPRLTSPDLLSGLLMTSWCPGLPLQTINKMAASIEWMSKEEALTIIFNRFDKDFTGELTAEQLQELHASIRDGGISAPQVQATIEAVCAAETCDRQELVDVLNEMDRRYFLVRDLQWEFAMLDREKKGTINEKKARFLCQAVHDDFFSHRRWLKFLRSRAAPGSGISFAEIEVLLCDIPTMDWLDEERQDEDKEKEGALRRKQEKVSFEILKISICISGI